MEEEPGAKSRKKRRNRIPESGKRGRGGIGSDGRRNGLCGVVGGFREWKEVEARLEAAAAAVEGMVEELYGGIGQPWSWYAPMVVYSLLVDATGSVERFREETAKLVLVQDLENILRSRSNP